MNMKNRSILNDDAILFEMACAKESKKLKADLDKIADDIKNAKVERLAESEGTAEFLTFIYNESVESILKYNFTESIGNISARIQKSDSISLAEGIAIGRILSSDIKKDDDVLDAIQNAFGDENFDIPEAEDGSFKVNYNAAGRLNAIRKFTTLQNEYSEDADKVNGLVRARNFKEIDQLAESVTKLGELKVVLEYANESDEDRKEVHRKLELSKAYDEFNKSGGEENARKIESLGGKVEDAEDHYERKIKHTTDNMNYIIRHSNAEDIARHEERRKEYEAAKKNKK